MSLCGSQRNSGRLDEPGCESLLPNDSVAIEVSKTVFLDE